MLAPINIYVFDYTCSESPAWVVLKFMVLTKAFDCGEGTNPVERLKRNSRKLSFQSTSLSPNRTSFRTPKIKMKFHNWNLPNCAKLHMISPWIT
jgi:hypothetical protein